MIGDRRPLSLKVQATSGAATSSDAVSLGLIVTELVINALKHAFRIGETGEILVGYDARGPDWTLSVSDNGAGSGDVSAERPHTGLGTSIVEALAHQLDAIVQKSAGPRGTTVSVTRTEARAGD
jgi:chemotaxis protein methyltransferase CheR